ncbi:hypothetical protein Rvan_0493 [Rhodomicrobium vannielii ATCC 17100]|uniref:Uncharacterized protein n=1 Tax=Rhodomicrobium vannielii (strain ATCC 17100 / DSM 162 / LMG 4299 / NCIMB 10020 / ATH 3.1.1) TaxID=648757 RepID=E3HYN4_RHOVT|nr:ABC transporter substrate-binding protein [Rhodomicrobium vannielii]ADP69775.1 hypothetical protein Rvan_0493 [Rhodomicrobium vannielii ATCC 17100]
MLDALDEEPVFPEEDDARVRRRLDYLARPYPPLQREMRRSIHLLLRDEHRRSGLEAAWYVARVGPAQPYDDIAEATDPDTIPALISDPGLGGIARQPFVERWLDTGVFEQRQQVFARRDFTEAGFADPTGLFQVDGAGSWVILVDKTRLAGRPIPRSWEDLLHPQWQGDILSSGQNGVVLALLLVNLAQDFGLDGMRAFARNVREVRGGAAMARYVGTDDPRSAAICVLPNFWAHTVVRRDRSELVWPREGAYAPPILRLKKSETTPAANFIEAYITGREWAARMESARCFSVRDDVPAEPPGGALRWIGWERARSLDFTYIRETLVAAYLKERTP